MRTRLFFALFLLIASTLQGRTIEFDQAFASDPTYIPVTAERYTEFPYAQSAVPLSGVLFYADIHAPAVEIPGEGLLEFFLPRELGTFLLETDEYISAEGFEHIGPMQLMHLGQYMSADSIKLETPGIRWYAGLPSFDWWVTADDKSTLHRFTGLYHQPEPSGWILAVVGLAGIVRRKRTK